MRRLYLLAAIPAFALPAAAHAAGYDYEIAISYDASRASSESVATTIFQPINIQSNSDYDEIGFAGTWYFNGADASVGPRSRAAFISRASAASLSYSRGNGDSIFTLNRTSPFIPSMTQSAEETTNNVSANLRRVWRESGWYALAGFSMAEFKAQSEFVSTKLEADVFSLGIGKYIGAQTTLELTAVRQDSDASGAVIAGDSTSTELALGFSHMGGLGRTWQYGTDIVMATTGRGSADGSYSARLSLYPSRPLAFGIEIAGALQDADDVSTDYGLFASWFPRELIELQAHYGRIAVDEPPGVELDQYDFGLGVSFRF